MPPDSLFSDLDALVPKGAAPSSGSAAPPMPDTGTLPGKPILDPLIAPNVPNGAPRPFAPGEMVENPGGSWSSEITVTTPLDGKWAVLPSLWLVDGKPTRVSEDQATEFAKRSGLNFKTFDTEAQADQFSTDRESTWQKVGRKGARSVPPLWSDRSSLQDELSALVPPSAPMAGGSPTPIEPSAESVTPKRPMDPIEHMGMVETQAFGDEPIFRALPESAGPLLKAGMRADDIINLAMRGLGAATAGVLDPFIQMTADKLGLSDEARGRLERDIQSMPQALIPELAPHIPEIGSRGLPKPVEGEIIPPVRPAPTVEPPGQTIEGEAQPAPAAAGSPTQEQTAAAPRETGPMPASTVTDDLARELDSLIPDGTSKEPIKATTADDVARAREQVDPNPTPAQIEAGNAKLGHLEVQGLPIAIETPQGGTRTDAKHDPPLWSVPDFPADYGRIKGTKAADGEPVDAYIGPNPQSDTAFVIDQIEPNTGKYDEAKTFIGFDTAHEAQATYDAAFPDGSGPARRSSITAMPMDVFKNWVKSPEASEPASYERPPLPQRQLYDDILDGVVKPSAPAIAGRYGIGEREAAMLLDQISKRPDTPIEVAKNGSTGDPMAFGWRRVPDDRREGQLRDADRWAYQNFGLSRVDFPSDADFVDAASARSKDFDAMRSRADELGIGPHSGSTFDELAAMVHEREGIMAEGESSEHLDQRADAVERQVQQGVGVALPEAEDEIPWGHEEQPTPPVQVAPEPVEAGPVAEAGAGHEPGAGEAPPGARAGALPAGGGGAEAEGHPGAGTEPAAAVASGRGVDRRGNPIFREGDRVVLPDGSLAGRHGVVTEAHALVMRPLFGGLASEPTYTYHVKTDHGSTEIASRLTPERGAAPVAVPDILDRNRYVDPAHFRDSISSATTQANKYRAAAARTRKPENRRTLENEAKQADAEAQRKQALLDEWRGRHPAEAQRVLGTITPRSEAPKIETGGDGMSIVEATHTRDKYPLFVVTMKDRVDAQRFNEMRAAAKTGGGWYSAFRGNGAVPGFQFKTREGAEAFMRHHGRASAPENLGEPSPTRPPGWTAVGKNADGQTLYEDPRGVRSIVENGIRRTEPVSVSPRGEIGTNRQSHPEFTAEKPAPAAETYGESNRVFTSDMAERARAILRAKMNQLRSGLDPEMLNAGITLAGYHIEAGARAFADFTKAMVNDLGDTVQPYLRTFYESVRHWPGFDARGMTAAEEIEHGLQRAVPSGHAGEGPGAVQPVAPQREAGPIRPAEELGRPRDAGGPPAGQGGQPGGAGVGGGAGDVRDAGLPRAAAAAVARAARGSPDAEVRGQNFVIAPGAVEEGRGFPQKARDNLDAIELAKSLIADGRLATRDEQAVLAKYVGWGGLRGAFDAGQGFGKGFEDVGRRLKDLLTKDEYETAARSTQYAHYTAEHVIRSMWDAVERMGFKGGSVFEPGMGVGHFLGMMPPDLAKDSHYQGMELDHLTADIAKLLYPESGVRQADFTRTPIPENAFDLAIGNPPFSDVVIRSDPKYSARGFMLHDYFFAKSLDSVRPGGLMGYVTSAGTMNKLEPAAREYLAQRAEFAGGIRLPSNAFARNAGTEVTTDILFFKKRPAMVPLDQVGDTSWTQVVPRTLPGSDGKPVEGNVSRYFSEHPEMVLGTEGFTDKLYKGRYGVQPIQGRDLAEDLSTAVGLLPRDIMQPEPTPEQKAELDLQSGQTKDGSFYVKDGKLMQYRGGAGTAVPRRGAGTTGGMTAADLDRVTHLVPIRDALRDVFRADLASDAPAALDARDRLNSTYDTFVKKFGPINKAEFQYRRPTIIQQEGARAEAREMARELGNPWREGDFDPSKMMASGASISDVARERSRLREEALANKRSFDEGTFSVEEMPDVVIEKRPNIEPFMDDQESYRLRSIEDYNDATGEAAKKRIFTESILTRENEPVIKSPEDGVMWSLNKFGRLNVDEIGTKLGLPADEVVRQLGDRVFKVPGTEDTYQAADEYLSGDVKDKLAAARAAAETDPAARPNVLALEKVQPPPLAPSEIAMTAGMPWIPPDVFETFAANRLNLGNVRVRYNEAMGRWITGTPDRLGEGAGEWGTTDITAVDLLNNALNRTTPRVYREERDEMGNKRQVFDPVASQAAQDKVDAMKVAFDDMARGDKALEQRLSDLYNDKFNRVVLRNYDGSYLTTPGVSTDWSWRPHQTRVISRIILDGNTYMAHAVGAGKTSAMIGAGMEMRRLGLVRKPMYVVPRHMLGQFTKEFYEQYPLAKVAVADERQFHTGRRKQFMANVAQDDLDGIVITHPAFGKVPISQEYERHLIAEQVDDLSEAIESLDKHDDRITIRRLENMKEKLEQKLSRRGEGKDLTNTFEEMGVDFLFIDEAQMFRKLSFATKQGQLKGITPEGSQMAWDLYTKARYLNDQRPGRGLVLASGTPIVNTMGELYSISRFLQPDELAKRGLGHFDSWASTFGDIATKIEQTAEGAYAPVTRFSRFVNMPELYKMVGGAMDVVTPNQLEQYVVRPQLKGGARQMHLAPRTPELDAFQASLAQRVQAIKNRKGPPKKGDDILLSVINDGRLGAIDPRFVLPGSDAHTPSKLNDLIDNAYRIWKETKDQQFFDPKTDYKTPLMRGPATQMIFSNLGIDAEGKRGFSGYEWMKRELIRRGVPKGELAFIKDYSSHIAKQKLFNDMNEGKVRILIGSTQKMGTGVNAQRRLYAIHNLDPLWFPADDEQRMGRIVRQGNLNPEVEGHDYSTKGTYDATMWQMMANKGRFIEQFFRGDPELRDMEDLGEAGMYEQASAISTSDERVIKLTEMRQALEKAERRKTAHEREQYALTQQVRGAKDQVAYHTKRAEEWAQDAAKVTDTRADKFAMTIGDQQFTERPKAADELGRQIAIQAPLVTDKEPRIIGQIGGFPLALRKILSRREAVLLRPNGDELPVGNLDMPGGIITAAERRLRDFEGAAQHSRDQAAASARTAEVLAPQIGKPFTGGDEIGRLRKDVRDLEGQLKASTEKPKLDVPTDIGPAEPGLEPVARGLVGRPIRPEELTEKDRAFLDRLNVIARQMSPGATIQPFAHLASTAEAGRSGKIAGAYFRLRDADGVRQVISYALDARNPEATIRHETIHYLRHTGLITPAEWAILEKTARDEDWMGQHNIAERYRGLDRWDTDPIEEAIADHFGYWRSGKSNIPNAIRPIFENIAMLLRRIADAFKRVFGMDASAADIFSRVESGEIGARVPPGPEAFEAMQRDIAAQLPPKEPHLLETEEATPAEMATRQRQIDKVIAETKMLGRKVAKKPQETAESTPLFGEKGKQGTLFSAEDRPYRNVPDALMGYRRNGPQKGFDETKYPFVQAVRVTTPDGNSFVDQIKGMNSAHALERAHRNWEGSRVVPISNADFMRESDPRDLPMFQVEDTDIEPPSPEETEGPLGQRLAIIRTAMGRTAEAAADMMSDARLLVAPMAEGTAVARRVAKDFANMNRLSRHEWAMKDRWLEKNFTPDQRRTMFEALDEQSVYEQLKQREAVPAAEGGLSTEQRAMLDDMRAHEGSIGLNRLSSVERAPVEQLNAISTKNIAMARKLRMFDGDGIPWYAPRYIVQLAGDTMRSVRGEPGGTRGLGRIGNNIRATTSRLKHREHLTVGETEEAARAKFGDGATVVRDIRTVALANADLQKAIAGRMLVERIRKIGHDGGALTVSDGHMPDEPGWFTIADHPAFTIREPAGYDKDPATGALTPVKDANGNVVTRRVPLYIRGDFRGPLTAVMSRDSNLPYRGLMALKGKTMSVIMYSPAIHNQVEWGRALPVMPGKVASFRIYFEGNAARRGLPYAGVWNHVKHYTPGLSKALGENRPEPYESPDMVRAIKAGMVPIGRYFSFQDISSIANEGGNIVPGRSWTAKLLAAVPGMLDERWGDATKRAVDRVGNVYHNALLWDRVADLQMGLFINMEKHLTDKMIARGIEPKEAARAASIGAAHFANRYAGALPIEAMSKASRILSNIFFFSRTFTAGNLGVMKDAFGNLPYKLAWNPVVGALGREDLKVKDVGGLPRDAQALISTEAASVVRDTMRSAAQKKAVVTILADIALLYVGNAVLQSAIAVLSGDSTLDDEMKGYARRLLRLLRRGKDNALDLLNPFADLRALLPQSENEPGKEDYVRVGYAADGTAIYMNLPFGKMGREFEGWITGPLDMLRRKEGTLMRPAAQTFMNDDGFGNKVYNPWAATPIEWAKNLGRIVTLFMGDQVPMSAVAAVRDMLAGRGNQKVELAQAAGPLAGATFSKGAPGGPAVGQLYRARDEFEMRVRESMPAIRRQIADGDVAGARLAMVKLGISKGLQDFYVRTTLHPQARLTPTQMRQFMQYASPDERENMQRFIYQQQKATPAR